MFHKFTTYAGKRNLGRIFSITFLIYRAHRGFPLVSWLLEILSGPGDFIGSRKLVMPDTDTSIGGISG